MSYYENTNLTTIWIQATHSMSATVHADIGKKEPSALR